MLLSLSKYSGDLGPFPLFTGVSGFQRIIVRSLKYVIVQPLAAQLQNAEG
jgi:hypothetical protein